MSNKDLQLIESEANVDFFQEEINKAHMKEENEINQQRALIAFKGLSKVKIKEVALIAVSSVLEQGNPLEIAEALSSMELFIKEMKADDRFKNYVREELEKSKEFISTSGAKIELAETGTKYDFSKCDDFELDALMTNVEILKTKIEERQKFLKTLPIQGIDILNPETGELVKVYPPSKSSTSSYKVTLSK